MLFERLGGGDWEERYSWYIHHCSLLMSDSRSQNDVRGGDGESAGHC